MSGYGVSGIGIVSGTIFHPAEGTWSAEIEVHSGDAMSGAQTLQLPGLELAGVVVGGGISDLRQKLRLVGGRGGLSKTLDGQHFNSATVRTIVNALLGGAGERLDAQSDATVLAQELAHWQHVAGSAGHGLELLCRHIGSTWYVTPGGDVHIGAPSWEAHEPDHVLLHEDLKAGTYEISSTEETVQPGTSFLGQRVSAVEHVISDRKARAFVRWGSTMHPQDEELQRAVRRHQIFTMPAYEAEVVSQDASTGKLDLKPADPTVGKGWQRVPVVMVGPFSVKLDLTHPARCVVEFLDNNRSKPFVRSFLEASFSDINGGTAGPAGTQIKLDGKGIDLSAAVTASLDAKSVAVGGTATDVRLGKGTNFVAALGDPVVAAVIGTPANVVVKV